MSPTTPDGPHDARDSVSDAPASAVTVESRFAGPPGIGHGGYVAGLLSARWRDGAEVTLRQPTPLDVELQLDASDDDRSALINGEDLIADARPMALDLEAPEFPGVDAAMAATDGSPARLANDGRGVHPTCFGCGLVRADDDGLAIAAGPTDPDTTLVAAPWIPDDRLADAGGTVAHRFVAAALDCPGAFAYLAVGEPAGLLGRITLAQHRDVRAGESYVVAGWRIGVDGRKMRAGTALWAADGTLCAASAQIWFPFSRG